MVYTLHPRAYTDLCTNTRTESRHVGSVVDLTEQRVASLAARLARIPEGAARAREKGLLEEIFGMIKVVCMYVCMYVFMWCIRHV
jgi:hypothetical protein